VDRVFLDANVLFSAAYRVQSGLRRLWALPDTRLLTSLYALEEARRNLSTDAQRDELALLVATMEVVSWQPEAVIEVALADKDRPILSAATQAKASHLLTGDRTHFSHLFGQVVMGLRVLTPGEYLRLREPSPEGR
jgi:uncharacterized protein